MRKQWRRQRSKEVRSFRGQNILEPGHPDALFSSEKLTTFLVVALKTQRPPTPLRLFHCQNKTNEAVSDQIWQNFYFFLFTLLLKQSKATGRAEPGREPGRWIFQPGHLTWRALVWRRHCAETTQMQQNKPIISQRILQADGAHTCVLFSARQEGRAKSEVTPLICTTIIQIQKYTLMYFSSCYGRRLIVLLCLDPPL